eukprot:6718068-Prymnesium_polylepis.2
MRARTADTEPPAFGEARPMSTWLRPARTPWALYLWRCPSRRLTCAAGARGAVMRRAQTGSAVRTGIVRWPQTCCRAPSCISTDPWPACAGEHLASCGVTVLSLNPS